MHYTAGEEMDAREMKKKIEPKQKKNKFKNEWSRYQYTLNEQKGSDI